MAEFIFKALVRARGLEDSYYAESAAVSCEELGNPIYPPARRCLAQHGVQFDSDKRARRVQASTDVIRKAATESSMKLSEVFSGRPSLAQNAARPWAKSLTGGILASPAPRSVVDPLHATASRASK